MRKIIIVLLVLGIGMGFILCQKPKPIVEDTQTELSKDINELDVDDNFRWKTIKDVQVSLTSSTDEVALIKSEKGDVILKVFLKSGQTFDTKITVPTYVTEVTVVCKGQSQKLSVVNNRLTFDFK